MTLPADLTRAPMPAPRHGRATLSSSAAPARAPNVLGLVAIAVLLAGSAVTARAERGASAEPASKREAVNAKRIEGYYEAYRPGPETFERWLGFYDPDVSFRDPTYGAKVEGRDGMRKTGEQAGLNIAVEKGGMRWNLHRRLFDDEQVVVTGTYSGSYGDKSYDVRFLTWVTMRDGLIVEQLDIADTTTLMEQMGRAAAPSGQPEVTARVAPPPASAQPLSRAEAEQLVERYVSVYQEPRIAVDRFLAFYADDARFLDPTYRIDLEGREAIGTMMRTAIDSGFLNLRMTVARIAVEGPRIAFRGTLSGEYGGKTFSDIDFATLWTVVDGKIIDHLDFYDSRKWMKQVGILPTS